jgi:hypothetical protein
MPKKKPPSLNEQQNFEEDNFEDPEDKNQRLADLLQGPWLDFEIVRIDRIEIGAKGWRVVHRV